MSEMRKRSRKPGGWLAALAVGGVLVCCVGELRGEEAAAEGQQGQIVKLPGLVIDRAQGWVDLTATICLDHGFLELVACTKGSKEHESIVVLDARPVHLHTALLLLGANNGNPAMRKQVGETQKRWVDLPPRGDPIDAYLVLPDAEGKLRERPLSDFIVHATNGEEDAAGGQRGGQSSASAQPARKFPHTFLFAGSHLLDKDQGPRQYLADLSGHVISIATFGDEVLCLPSVHSKVNGALEWQVDSTHLPDVGTKVTLRLRPRKKKAARASVKTEPSSQQLPDLKAKP